MSFIRRMSTLLFREVDGDLFSAPKEYSLAHCVAADLKMGAGIAVKFRDVYGQIDKLKKQGVTAGGVAVLNDDSRFIYYLITKNDTYKKPTYKDLFSSLHAMKDHMQKNNVTKLAIPRIGCGLDGLEWDKVKDQLHDVFGDVPFDIIVYTFKQETIKNNK